MAIRTLGGIKGAGSEQQGRIDVSLDQSDLLFEGSAGSRGGGVSGGGLHRFVGHDASGEFLLRLLETGTGGSVERMNLFKHNERDDCRCGEEGRDQDHDDAHGNTCV